MSKITNLKGTTWRLDFNKLYGITAGYGVFDIDGSWYIDAGGQIALGPSDFVSMATGYYGDGMVNLDDLVATVDAIALGSPISQNGNIVGVLYYALQAMDTAEAFISLSITGGSDISNAQFIDFINTYGTLVSGGEPPTADSVKSHLQSLLTASNAKTGKSNANLTDAVKTLIEGYKQGITPSGSLDITENGTFDVTDKASVNVKVADNPLPIEVSTEAEMTALLETAEIGSVYKYTGETGTYENGALYVVEEEVEEAVTITLNSTRIPSTEYDYNETKIKFGSAPTDTQDFDYVSGGNYGEFYDRDGNTFKAPLSISVSTKAYIWQTVNDNGGYELNGSNTITTSTNYASATQVTLNDGDTVTLVGTYDG